MLNKKLKNIKYNIKNAMVIGALAASSLLPVSCDKEDPIDPIKAKQEQLKKIDAQLTKEIRVAIPNAKTNPINFTNTIEIAVADFGRINGWKMDNDNTRMPILKNIRDTVITHKGGIEMLFAEFGNPIPYNTESIAALYKLLLASNANYAEMQKMGLTR